jgi:hypothetical protein
MPIGARPGWKLRSKMYPGVFKLCRIYHRTAVIIQYDKRMIYSKEYKRRGGVHRPQYISVDRHRLKPVKDPAAYLGLSPTQKMWAHLVKILDQECGPIQTVYLMAQDNSLQNEKELNKFVLHFDASGDIYNDLSPKYKKELVINRTKILRHHKCPEEMINYTFYTAGKVIYPRSSVNFSHVTCSYGRSVSCMNDRHPPSTKFQLKQLKKGNLGTIKKTS